MENTKTKKKLKLWQRVLIIVLAVIVALVAALGLSLIHISEPTRL